MSAITWAVVLLAGLTCTLGQGTQTTLEQYPSIVQVEFRVGVVWLQQCIANVVTNYHVLSAASCFEEKNVEIRRIRAGAANRGVGGLVTEVSRIIHHPTYGMMDNDGDLAMIILSAALPLSDTIRQAAIIGQGIYFPTGIRMNLVGWGTTMEGGLVGNDYLHESDVYTVDDDTCLEMYIGEKIVTENMFCVRKLSNTGLDWDSRDAGGPVIYQQTTTGVISFGKSRSDDAFPVVATALSSYTSWIIETASEI